MKNFDHVENFKQAYTEWLTFFNKEDIILNTEENINNMPDIAECASRSILGIVYPSNKEQVEKFIKIANKFNISIYTVSCGKNWGLGSMKPIQNNCVVLHLSKLNKIIEINEEFGYAVLEPGVTVGSLYDCLKKIDSSFIFNVGGAGRNVSVVGNTLDRGSGFFGCKKLDDILGIEAILANGTTIRTGHWNISTGNDFVHTYPYGYGPDLRGLFIQSNLAVITKIVVSMHKKQRTLIVYAQDNSLELLIDAFKVFRSNNLIGSGVTFLVDTENHPCVHSAIVALSGTYNMMLAAKDDLIRLNNSFSKIKLEFFDTEEIDYKDYKIPVCIKDLGNMMFSGVSDEHYYLSKLQNKIKGIASLDLNSDIDSPENSLGFICINAVARFNGKIVKDIVDIVISVAPQYSITFSDLGNYALKAHVSSLFNRNDKSEVSKVHELKDVLYRKFEEIGIYPQRLDIDSMRYFNKLHSKEYQKTIHSIKEALDPKGILSPGRYIDNLSQSKVDIE